MRVGFFLGAQGIGSVVRGGCVGKGFLSFAMRGFVLFFLAFADDGFFSYGSPKKSKSIKSFS